MRARTEVGDVCLADTVRSCVRCVATKLPHAGLASCIAPVVGVVAPPKPAVLLTRPVGKGATHSYDFIRVSETVVCGYNTSIFLAGFSFADSFLGITTWSTPLSYLAEIPSLSTVLGKWNERQKDW